MGIVRKRTNFSERQKAEIYARDHATCAFSGISLWIFDSGIRSNYQMDWADHIKPSARGGASCLENGICASHTFNAKKKDNSNDNVFFFKGGSITPAYVRIFGFASQETLDDLDRRSALVPADWYLNRAIVNVYIALSWRCELELKGVAKKRDDAYWIKSARRRFDSWKKIRPAESLEQRKLINNPKPFGTDLLLAIEDVETDEQFGEWVYSLWPKYRANYKAFLDFYTTESHIKKNYLLKRLECDQNINPDVIKGLTQLLLSYQAEIDKAA